MSCHLPTGAKACAQRGTGDRMIGWGLKPVANLLVSGLPLSSLAFPIRQPLSANRHHLDISYFPIASLIALATALPSVAEPSVFK